MAGIGFRLKKLFKHDTFIDDFRGVLFSTSVAAGPIFFSILCLGILGIFSTIFLSNQELSVFLVTIVYVFAFSLISTGITQLLITRYLSDLIFVNHVHLILPTFSAVLAITVLGQLIIGLPFLFFWQINFLFKMSAFVLFITIGCIWQLMIFLSAVKNYRVILYAFVLGLSVSFVLALYLGKHGGLAGFLHGYTIGQLVLLFILLARVVIEFKSPEKPEFHFLKYLKTMPQLILIGFCYNLGIWIDKMIFWFSPHGQKIHSFLYAYSDYDGATFFAYLTVIPSYTYFLVTVETDFYSTFRGFYQAILDKEPFQQITQQKQKIIQSVKRSLVGMIKLQGSITLICLLFSQQIAAFFRIPMLGSLILEKALIATFLQMLLLTIMIFMMYFDIKNQISIVTAVFLLSNVTFTILTIKLGYLFFGYGYLFACLLALIVGYHLLSRHVKDLEYRTFTGQPIAS